MSFEEKSTWIMTVIGPSAFVVYLVIVLDRLETASVRDVPYEGPLLATIGAAVVAAIVAHIVVAAAAPKEADKRDERDVYVNRRGQYVGGFVLATGALGAMSLCLARFDYLWIASLIYLSFVLTDATASVVKLVGYRRGI